MSKYKVVETCYGFRGGYWEKGQIVDIDPKEKPPKWFVPINSPQKNDPPPEDPPLKPETVEPPVEEPQKEVPSNENTRNTAAPKGSRSNR